MIINSMKLERSQNRKRINSDKPITVRVCSFCEGLATRRSEEEDAQKDPQGRSHRDERHSL